jgi:parvulin-like peptidyl-prolyl isomerase
VRRVLDVGGVRAALLGWALLAGASAQAVDVTAPGYREVERVVAVVNTDVVLLSEVEEQLVPLLGSLPSTLKGAARQKRVDELRQEVLDSLVADRLMQQQVEVLGIEVTSEEVDRAIREVRHQNGLDEAQFKQALAQQGMSMGQYRESLRKQLVRAKIINIKVRGRVTLTPQDLDSAVARRLKVRGPGEFRVHARHAVFLLSKDATDEDVVAQQARAQKFYERVKSGESFEALVRTESDAPTQSGGDLGFFKRGEMMPEFEDVAFRTLPGQAAAPLRTAAGWHVIQVVERKSTETRSAAEVSDDIREQLMAEELERAFKRYVSELRSNSHVEIRR